MPSRPKTLSLGLALLALLLFAGSASAATYTVTRNDDPVPGPCEPDDCSLREALMASNGTMTIDDVVVVPASDSPYLIQYEELYLPITDEVEVRGAGANTTVVQGDGKESIFAALATKVIVSGLTITGGQAAIQNNGELLVRDVTVEGNQWNGGTAGILSNGPVTVESSFLGFNRTESVTAGVIFSNAPVMVVNSTIAHNTSKGGFGAIGANSSVTIVNSAVVSNRSETAPAAAVGGTSLTVRNSVFTDNRDENGLFNCSTTGTLTSLGGNISDDGSCGTTATDKPNVDPLLGALGLYGGTTHVYSLLIGSPAIDAGSDCPAVDQRGVARPQGAACDSGPFEFVPPPPPAATVVASAATAVDSALAMKLGKGKLFVSRKGRTKVKLACPASETSPPCTGTVKLAGRFGAKARFSIGAGETKAVKLRLLARAVDYLREHPEKRIARVVVRAEDAAGNQQLIKQRRKLVLR
ncbi:MAG TPA: right-handed parallel beta-helix repeat-containing protein [Solirubrobacterales bacterium]|nr:right-handed parallel beta-helix repeat-containing protein [Solirubrobacterales bacterium]